MGLGVAPAAVSDAAKALRKAGYVVDLPKSWTDEQEVEVTARHRPDKQLGRSPIAVLEEAGIAHRHISNGVIIGPAYPLF